MRDQNIAFLLKFGFKVVSDKEAIWARVFRSKYGLDDPLSVSITRDQSSFFWKSLSKVWTILRENLIWSVHNRHKVKCWKNSWILSIDPLINHIPVFANINIECLLSDLVTEKGNWNFSLLQVWLPDEIVRHIRGVAPLHPLDGPNRLSWCHTSTRAFSIKSASKH